MNPQPKPRLSTGARRALNRFEEAVRDHEMVGSKHPDDRAIIEQEYKCAKQLLEAKLASQGVDA